MDDENELSEPDTTSETVTMDDGSVVVATATTFTVVRPVEPVLLDPSAIDEAIAAAALACLAGMPTAVHTVEDGRGGVVEVRLEPIGE